MDGSAFERQPLSYKIPRNGCATYGSAIDFRNATHCIPFTILSYQGYTTLFVMAIGLITNILTLCAAHTHVNPRPSIYRYVCALAIWSILFLFADSLLHVWPIVLYSGTRAPKSWVPYYGYLLAFGQFTLIGNAWTLMMLAVVRFWSLKHPLQNRALRGPGRLMTFRYTMMLCLMVAGFYSWPRILELDVISCFQSSTNETLYELVPTNLRRNKVYYLVCRIVGGLLFYSLLPYVVILTLTVVISRELTTQTERSQLTSTKTLEAAKMLDSSNRIIMCLNVKYLSSFFLTVALDVIELLMSTSNFSHNATVATLVTVSNLMHTINAATNFWVYFCTSAYFRRGVSRVLKGHCGQEQYTIIAAGQTIRMLMKDQAAGIIQFHCEPDGTNSGGAPGSAIHRVPSTRSRITAVLRPRGGSGTIIDQRTPERQSSHERLSVSTSRDSYRSVSTSTTRQLPAIVEGDGPSNEGGMSVKKKFSMWRDQLHPQKISVTSKTSREEQKQKNSKNIHVEQKQKNSKNIHVEQKQEKYSAGRGGQKGSRQSNGSNCDSGAQKSLAPPVLPQILVNETLNWGDCEMMIATV